MKTIIKICSIISVFVLSLMLIPKTYASISLADGYSICSSFTFSEDMPIDEGLEMIKPYILLYEDEFIEEDYDFTWECLSGTRYEFRCKFANNKILNVQTNITILANTSGKYVVAESWDPRKEVIYVFEDSLDDGKTVNDCLSEVWNERWMCNRDPQFNIPTDLVGESEVYVGNYVAYDNEVHEVKYKAIIDSSSSEGIQKPTDTPNTNTPTEKPGDTNTPNDTVDDSNNFFDNITESDTNSILLIGLGTVVLIAIIFIIYKIGKVMVMWLRR